MSRKKEILLVEVGWGRRFSKLGYRKDSINEEFVFYRVYLKV